MGFRKMALDHLYEINFGPNCSQASGEPETAPLEPLEVPVEPRAAPVQSCEMSNLLHGENLRNQILPQEKRVNRDTLRHRWNKINTKGYFWGTKGEHIILV